MTGSFGSRFFFGKIGDRLRFFGNAVQEHIYLGDRPVAVVQGQGGSVGYVTTDQLNTPRAVTDASQAIEWSWTSDPFGNGQPTGSLSYNLRFPGQYYDAETGHNYNYFRDYDPGTGRYIESDPIGLVAGVNTYIYTYDNPSSLYDQFGTDALPAPVPMPPLPLPSPAQAQAGAQALQAAWNALSSAAQQEAAAFENMDSELVDAFEKPCPNQGKCPPCSPPVGTIGYRIDVVPPSKPHWPLPGTHVHLYRMNQNPNNCQCFWHPIGVTEPPPPPGAVPLG